MLFRSKSLYATSKSGIETLTRNLALELSESNIRVNCVNPGPTDTDLLKSHFFNDGKFNSDAYSEFSQSLPLKHLVSSEDVANLVFFLCGKMAQSITGQIITVDSGRSLRW